VQRFTPQSRLRKPAEFKAVFAAGKRFSGQHLGAVISDCPGQEPRLGLAIAKRAVPHAVDRNRIKRQIRESFRVNRSRLPQVDVVFKARNGAAQAENAQLRAELEQLWKRVRERWGIC
jgi:ribonuclease P protein component